MKQIFLRKYESKQSTNGNNSLDVSLKNSKGIIPSTDFDAIVNVGELYDNERQSCNKIRLNCVIKPYCTNILYNPFTEVVQNEGSDSAVCLNFLSSLDHENLDIPDELFYKEKDAFKGDEGDSKTLMYNLIDDTQLSSKSKGNLEYHCGLDFFNNHILRSTTFKTVNPMEDGGQITPSNYNNFNTLTDYHRRYNGTIVSGDTTVTEIRDFSKNRIVLADNSTVSAPYANHIYTFDDLQSFTNCVKNKLIEENGWVGFINKGKLKIYDMNNNSEFLDISKPLNNKEACEFVDMYPTRDLFSFSPKYNLHRHRIEKNWNYCITYPSSSVTSGIPFIDERVDGGALRLFLVNTTFDNIMRMHSMSKHGVREGDYIELYRDGVLEISTLRVTDIVDDYTFDVSKDGYDLGLKMAVTFNNEQLSGRTTYKMQKEDARYYSTDTDFLTFSFKKLVNGRGVDYYVRIFSKLPNWKFANKKITEKLVSEDVRAVTDYQKISDVSNEQFENHIANLAFSKTIYNDDVSEIIFTDDIDISYLKDNRGRPLTNIYLTIVKNNKGYNEWYNTEGAETSASTVEYSHCFGRVSCGFMLSDKMYDVNYESDDVIYNLSNTRLLCESGTTVLPFSGLSITNINDSEHVDPNSQDLDDTVNYYYNNNYYGDLCYYSYDTSEEVVIQNVDYRFNTYQREHWEDSRLNYCNINQDDYDTNDFSASNYLICKSVRMGNQYEGYYYNPHYPIPIKTISVELSEQSPKIFSIRRIDGTSSFKIFTNENNYLEKDDRCLLYVNGNNVDWFEKDVIIRMKVTEVLGFREFVCVKDENFDAVSDKGIAYGHFNNANKAYFRILKPDVTIPSYADFVLDGTCKYVWRNIIENGFDNDSNIERYPFTNGRLYVMKDIDFFLKRQNPSDKTILTNHMFDDFKENIVTLTEDNKYYEEDKIKC